MATSSKLMRKSSTLEIVKQKEVSMVEETYHELVDNDQTEGGAGETENGENGVTEDTTQGGPKSQGWNKIAKVINLSAVLNEASPPVEEGGTLDLSAEDFRVGIPYRFKVHLEQLEGNTLVVTCDPTEGASIKIATHEKEGIVTYMCTIVPREEGEFTLSTLFGKKQVLGSPFKVKFNSPADASLCSLKEAPEECRTSVDVNTLTFCVRTNQERGGLLTASAKSLSSKANIPVSISESGQGHYDVEFDANDGKKYRLTVKFDNQHINGSPFLLNLSDASVCTVAGDGITRGIVGQDNSFDVFTKGAGPGKLRVKVEGKSSAVVLIKPKGEDVYEVNYFPKKVGSYQITVLWLEEEIPGSPFVVPCHKPVGVTVPKPEKYNIYLIGESYKFKVDAKESGEGTLDADTVEQGSVDLNVTSLGKNQYRVDMIPRAVGIAHISIRWSGTEVPGSPFPVDIQCKPESSQVTTSGPVYEVGSNKPVTLEFNTEKAGAGKLKAKCAGEKSKNVAVTISDPTSSRIRQVSFVPTKPDVYTLWVTWSKTQVPGSPFIINLHPSNASSCQLVGGPVIPQDWQEPAILVINTSGAGSGELEVRAEGEKTGTVADEQITKREREGGELEISFVAPTPDIYKLYASWGGEDIPKSPFLLNRIPPDAERCLCSIPSMGPKWDDKVEVHLNASTAGNGQLAALAIGNNVGEVSECITITPDEKEYGIFVMVFTPKQPDVYTLTLEWAGKPIPGFPRKLNKMPYDPSKVVVYKQPQGLTNLGQDITIGVDTSNGGPGEISSTCTINKGGDIPVSVTNVEENKYRISFAPSEDIYSLSVMWGERHISGSPFSINLIPVDASRVESSELTFPAGPTGPVEVTLSTEEAGTAPFTVVCMGAKSGRVDVSAKPIAEHKHLISFVPPQQDFFTMGVKYGDKNINSSPFHFNTYPPDANLVVVTPPGQLTVDQSVQYSCDVSKAGCGKLTATVTRQNSRPVDAVVTSTDQGGKIQHEVSFLPEQPDIFTLSIKWEENEVKGSPFVLNLQPLDATQVKAISVHIPDEPGSEYAYVILDCSKVGVAPIVANVLGNDTGLVETEIEQLPNFHHKIKFIPPKDDKYTVTVLYNNEDIPGSPFVMNIVSPQPENVKLIDTSIPNQLLPLVTLTFDTSEAGRGKMVASTRGLKSGEVNNHEVSESTPGTWKVSFIPPFPDTYSVSSLWAKREIPHSPFLVNLESAVASDVAVGELHIPDQAGEDEEVWIDLDCSSAGHDVLRGTLEDTASLAPTQESEVISLGPKKYRLKVKPKDPRLYNFSVRYGRDHVQGSPFEVDLQLCLPEGVKLTEASYPQYSDGTEGYVVLDTKEAGRGKLSAKLTTERKQEIINLTPQEVEKKIYKVTFIPSSPDSYSLEIFWSDFPIPQSPNHFKVLLPICPEKVKCKELVGYAPGQLAQLEVSTHGAGLAPLTATCTGEKYGEVEVKVDEKDTDSHVVTFTPQSEDKYSLKVYYSGTEVPGSPFSLDLVLDPLKCSITNDNDLRLPIHIDQEVTFTVNTTKGGHGKLGVSVTSPDGQDTTTYLSVTQPQRGIHQVSFTPTVKGEYEIKLEWGQGCIPGSPIVLDVHEPAVPIYYNGKPVTVQLKRLYAPLSEITALAVHVRTEKHRDVTISNTKKGEFLLAFDAKTPGMYKINVFRETEEIKGSPLYIRYAAPAKPNACVLKSLATSTHIGETVDFELDATGAGFGEISILPDVPLSGMESKVNIRDNRDGTYIIQYTPQAVGKHSILVNWAGRPVPNSPLILQVDRPKNSEGLAQLAEGEEILFQEPHSTDSPLEFSINTPEGARGKLSVSIHGPTKPELAIEEKQNNRYTCRVTSSEPGNFWIHVLWKRRHIEGSPFLLTLVPQKATKVLGLNTDTDSVHLSTIHIKEEDQCFFEGPLPAGTDIPFTLVTGSAGRGELSVSCAGAGNAEVDIKDNNDGTHTCTLKTTEQGEYQLHILWEKIHIKGSPFSMFFLPQKAVQMLGLNPGASLGLAQNVTIPEEEMIELARPQPVQPVVFRIMTERGGKGELCVSGRGLADISVGMIDIEEKGVQPCRLTPSAAGEYLISVLWNKSHIPGSPFVVTFTGDKARSVLGIQHSSLRSIASSTTNTLARVHVVIKDMENFEHTHNVNSTVDFSVSTKRAGKGVLTLTTQGPGIPKVTIGEVKNYLCLCSITARIAGRYKIHLLWNNEKVDDYPLELKFVSAKRQVTGIDLNDEVLPVNQSHKFKVFHDAGPGEETLELFCVPSTAATIQTPIGMDTYYQCELTPLVPGNHEIVVRYKGEEILGSPFSIHFHSEALPTLILPTPPIPHNITVYGPGLSQGIINQEGNFSVDTTSAGLAKLDFEVVGPYGGFSAQLRKHWENDKLLLARYDPTLPGKYTLVMRWAGIEIPGSPFEVNIRNIT